MTFAKPPTEIHCHMLPGVDDGARDLDESIEMASVAAADGTRAIVVTPHVRSVFITDVWLVRDAFRELRLAIAGMGIAVELHCGGELGHDLVGRLEQPSSRQSRSAPRPPLAARRSAVRRPR